MSVYCGRNALRCRWYCRVLVSRHCCSAALCSMRSEVPSSPLVLTLVCLHSLTLTVRRLSTRSYWLAAHRDYWASSSYRTHECVYKGMLLTFIDIWCSTSRGSAKTAKSRIMQTARHDSPRSWWNSNGVTSTGTPNARGVGTPFPRIHIIIAKMIVWRVRGKIIESVLCSFVCDSCAQCSAHTYEQTQQLFVGLI